MFRRGPIRNLGAGPDCGLHGRLAALLVIGFLALGPASQWAYSQSESTAGTDTSATGAGTDSASAGQNASGTSTATDGSASGTTSGEADASQTSGTTTTTAGAETEATANVNQQDQGFVAESNAAATETTNDTPNTVTANATADTTGEAPIAEATATNGTTVTNAKSIYGVEATASAPPGGTIVTKENRRKYVAIAIAPDKTYSIAVTTKRTAFAKSGACFGGCDVFSGKTLNAAIKAAVTAYAKATRNFGSASANAESRAYSTGGGGWASASSSSRAFACVGNCRNPRLSNSLRKLAKLNVNCHWQAIERKLYCKRRI